MRAALLPGIQRRLFQYSLLRFILVGGLGEGLYLLLYSLAVRAGSSSLIAISVAGSTCLVVNAFLHARISFRLDFRWRMLAGYALIQGFCLILTLTLGWILDNRGASTAGVGLASLLFWSCLSFLLTRFFYRRTTGVDPSAGLASRQTNQRPR
jgi:putative flippase GtrA